MPAEPSSPSDVAEEHCLGVSLGTVRGVLVAGMTILPDRVSCTVVLSVSGEKTVLLHEPEAPRPRSRPTEVRGDGVWMEMSPETSAACGSVGLESFALEVDDGSIDDRDARGRRVPFGLELSWEADASLRRPDALRSGGRVMGEAMVGDRRISVDDPGWYRRLRLPALEPCGRPETIGHDASGRWSFGSDADPPASFSVRSVVPGADPSRNDVHVVRRDGPELRWWMAEIGRASE